MDDREVVTESAWTPVVLWVGFPLLGAGLGWLVKAISGWVAGREWAPFKGLFKLIASIDEPQATIGALAVGALAGVVFGFIGAAESMKVSVSYGSVELARRWKSPRNISRANIKSAFMDGKYLVLLGENTAEIAREKSDLDGQELQAAFKKHGYAWLDADPYAAEFRRWVEDDPSVPGSGNALLKARAKALKDDNEGDISELRGELAKIGIVVRDEKKRQYWRLPY